MDSSDIKRLALVLAVQAEIEGMKAENLYREMNGNSLSFGEKEFNVKAEELRTLAYKHKDQL